MQGSEQPAGSFVIRTDSGCSLTVAQTDILRVPVDALVCQSDQDLSLSGGLGRILAEKAGPEFVAECRDFMEKIERLAPTMAIPTGAGTLQYKGIIHAAGPPKRDRKTISRLSATIGNCLMLADRKGWISVAFPALGTGIFEVDYEMSAHAFKQAIPSFFTTDANTCITSVWLCLTPDAFPVYERILKS
ncbi:MAG: macro domain-containing protein [Desulfatibacillaceae bacterium]